MDCFSEAVNLLSLAISFNSVLAVLALLCAFVAAVFAVLAEFCAFVAAV